MGNQGGGVGGVIPVLRCLHLSKTALTVVHTHYSKRVIFEFILVKYRVRPIFKWVYAPYFFYARSAPTTTNFNV